MFLSTYFRLKVNTLGKCTYFSSYVPVCTGMHSVHTGTYYFTECCTAFLSFLKGTFVYILVRSEYILKVPDSIARQQGPAGALASDAGTSPRIEPNHSTAGLFTTAFRHRRVCNACPAAGARHQQPHKNTRWCITHLACEHCEVLGLGASARPCHPQNFLEVVLQGVEQFLVKYSLLLLL